MTKITFVVSLNQKKTAKKVESDLATILSAMQDITDKSNLDTAIL